MGWVSDDKRRLLERWTLLAGGVEMLIGASMSAFPEVFPSWLQIIAIAIAVITIGVGLTLVYTDITNVAALLRLKPSAIGPIISLGGLVVILGLGLWYFYHAPQGSFIGSSTGIILVAAILVLSFVFLTVGRIDQAAGSAGKTANLQIELMAIKDEISKSDVKISKYITETTATIDSILKNQNDRTLKILSHLKAQYELNEILRLRPKIDRLAKLLERPASDPNSPVDWDLWYKRYRLYRRALENFIMFSQDYHKNIQNIILTVPNEIYKTQGWELDPKNFPGDALHDFKTFRYISVQYESYSEECVSSIRAVAKVSI